MTLLFSQRIHVYSSEEPLLRKSYRKSSNGTDHRSCARFSYNKMDESCFFFFDFVIFYGQNKISIYLEDLYGNFKRF
jgi:hypothetical protein